MGRHGTIAGRKSAQDSKRAAMFTKYARLVTVAAKAGGDPDYNPSLRTAIDKAKAIGMPNDNITRAIKKGTGELAGESYEEQVYEGYGAGGVAVVITGLIQGAGTELGFAAFRYKKWNMASMSLAGILSGVLIYIYELFYLQYYMLTPMMHVGHLVIRSISAVVFAAAICMLAGNGLAKTGVMKGYAIGAAAKAVQVYEDEE